ncbi:hypothetical protein BMW23_0250 [Bodo saltans virus]|uniref:Uncharacterized protein n=1 Tax=Bodo saltans virus TaxID=2024608 RepID=A0A2H4UTU0_9VIRU|nr:hypothetical protein QJ851_gp0245 [Bodo saltans virus]ATZ80308.1 hypothetical protein BMW23_0250 [Bodo saltans virus]
MSIFKKKTQQNTNDNCTSISKEDIINNMPESVSEHENEHLKEKFIEFRWRIYKFPNEKELIEISQKKPKENRLFMSHGNKWIEYKDEHLFEELQKYKDKEYFYYKKI